MKNTPNSTIENPETPIKKIQEVAAKAEEFKPDSLENVVDLLPGTQLLESANTEKSECVQMPRGYRLSEQLRVQYSQKKKDVKEGEPESNSYDLFDLCSYFVATHTSRDKDNNGWATVFKLKDYDGEIKTFLKHHGLDFKTKDINKIITYIESCKPTLRLRSVGKIGWYNEQTYILPQKTYSTDKSEEFRLACEGTPPEFKLHETLQEWNDNIGKYAEENSRVVIGILIALSSPILKLLKKDNFGLHLIGNSSTGKSTALEVACSVFGTPFRSWRTTDNAAESWAMLSNDNLLALDDMGQASSDTVSEMTYMLGNGQGKGRANIKGVARDTSKFNICFLSTGEIGVEAKLREGYGKHPYHAGQAVRMMEIPADAGKGYGIYEKLHDDFNDGAALSNHFKEMAKSYSGGLGDEWLTWLVNDKEKVLNSIQDYMKKFIKDASPEEQADGQVKRARGHFALMAGVGEAAIEEGFLNWSQGKAKEACITILNDWISHRGGVESHECMQAAQRLKKLVIEEYSRFENSWAKKHANFQKEDGDNVDSNGNTKKTWDTAIQESVEKPIKKAGYRKPTVSETLSDNSSIEDKMQYVDKHNRPDKFEYYIERLVFEKEILQGNAKEKSEILQYFVKNGLIKQDENGKNTVPIRIPAHGLKRMYKVDNKAFED
jgi:uncharacterized protein (DUF927 family)